MLVLIEKTDRGYRATSRKPLEAETEGETRDEALGRLRDLLTSRLQGPIEVVDLEVPGESQRRDNPWLRLHGALRDDPSFDDWQDVIQSHRRAEDEAAGIFPDRNP